MITIYRYPNASGRVQFAYLANARYRRGTQHKFISAWLANEWVRRGLAAIVDGKPPVEAKR
jgi:hypothetical protein